GSTWGACKTEPSPVGLGRGSIRIGTDPIESGQCARPVITQVQGVTSSSVVHWSFRSDPYGSGFACAGGAVLQIYAFTSENAVEFRVCNNSTRTAKPVPLSINWDVF